MKLLPSLLISTVVHGYVRIPGAKRVSEIIERAKSRGNHYHSTIHDHRHEDEKDLEKGDWYSINDGVMGGISTGSASWYSLNDGVMGGVSSGASVPNDDYLVYKGQLSLANNGGFSQIRHDTKPGQFDGAKSLTLSVRASEPGREFKFIASASTSDWNLNIWEFGIAVGTEWKEITIPLNEMDLQIMGKIIPNGQKLTGEMIKKIGFMIMDKNTDPFELHVKDIRASTVEKEEEKWYSINDGVMGGISSGSASWYSINDGVMGGISSGAVKDRDQYLVYQGQLSLENNGGFSQIRHDTDKFNGANGVRLTLKASAANRDFKFIASASTSDWNLNIWEKSVQVGTDEMTIDIAFDDMDLQIMGKIISDGQKLTGDMIKKIGFLIMDKNTDPFELHIINIEPLGGGPVSAANQPAESANENDDTDFAEFTNHKWYSINDNVMGGKSAGHFTLDEETSDFTFWGELSFENRGGFASIRTPVGQELSGADGVSAVVTGDGRTYSLTAHSKTVYFGHWETEFKTVAGEQTSIWIPFDEMKFNGWGKFGGGDRGPIDVDDIKEIGFMMADKQPDEFKLKIHHVKPYTRDAEEKWDSQEYHPQHFDTRPEENQASNLANWYSNNWYSVNDDVMGGVSHGSPARNKVTKDLKFWGQLSMENNGGFSTIRTDVGDALDNSCGLKAHVRGDGRTYQFTAYPADMKGRYQMDVQTVKGEDTHFDVNFGELEYHFWGWKKPMKPLTVDNVKGIGFMIADKDTTPFDIDIVDIHANFDCDVTDDHSQSASHEKSHISSMLQLEWYALNDGVMGGVSSGSVKLADNQLLYRGQLSLENRGGFSTIRANVPKMDKDATGVEIKVKGSNRPFKLNLGKSTSDMNLHQWSYTMDIGSEWKTIKVPFTAFTHEIMGRRPGMVEPITARDIEKISIQISDKNTEPFELNIASIDLY